MRQLWPIFFCALLARTLASGQSQIPTHDAPTGTVTIPSTVTTNSALTSASGVTGKSAGSAKDTDRRKTDRANHTFYISCFSPEEDVHHPEIVIEELASAVAEHAKAAKALNDQSSQKLDATGSAPGSPGKSTKSIFPWSNFDFEPADCSKSTKNNSKPSAMTLMANIKVDPHLAARWLITLRVKFTQSGYPKPIKELHVDCGQNAAHFNTQRVAEMVWKHMKEHEADFHAAMNPNSQANSLLSTR